MHASSCEHGVTDLASLDDRIQLELLTVVHEPEVLGIRIRRIVVSEQDVEIIEARCPRSPVFLRVITRRLFRGDNELPDRRWRSILCIHYVFVLGTRVQYLLTAYRESRGDKRRTFDHR